MDDDFNSALALAHMNDEMRSLKKILNEVSKTKSEKKWRQFYIGLYHLKKAGETLGLFFMQPDEFEDARQKKKIEGLNINERKILA